MTHDVIAWPARVKLHAGPQWSVTDAREQNNTGLPTLCVGGPVTTQNAKTNESAFNLYLTD